jgi:nucleoside-diphosphate-sugar epimerase
MAKRVLILGINGFIGCHLADAILRETDWQVVGLDLQNHKLGDNLQHPRMRFKQGDMLQHAEWIERQVQEADVVLPLAAIANPQIYVQDPLKVFELDFEANLPIVRLCVKYNKHLVFPSTSEVYGMSNDAEFKETESNLVLGPVTTPRWIYSCSKQLMDRVILAYAQRGELKYTLFRPFNWFGPKLDDLQLNGNAKSRVLTNFLSQILQSEDLVLVDGGMQRRSFTYIDDAIQALLKIIENKNGCAEQEIFNIGNPNNDHSIKELAEMLLSVVKAEPELAEVAASVKCVSKDSGQYYGKGYQDIAKRVPSIQNAVAKLDWQPTTDLRSGLEKTVNYVAKQALSLNESRDREGAL